MPLGCALSVRPPDRDQGSRTISDGLGSTELAGDRGEARRDPAICAIRQAGPGSRFPR